MVKCTVGQETEEREVEIRSRCYPLGLGKDDGGASFLPLQNRVTKTTALLLASPHIILTCSSMLVILEGILE